jgi:hypothetical protein
MNGKGSHDKQTSTKIFLQEMITLALIEKGSLLIYSIDLLSRSTQSTVLRYSLIRASKNLRT